MSTPRRQSDPLAKPLPSEDDPAVDTSLVRDRTRNSMLIRLLNDCLANEICCVLLYSRRQYFATKHHGTAIAGQFLQSISDEQSHADRLAARIVDLGGELACEERILDLLGDSSNYLLESEAELVRATLASERWSINAYRMVLSHLGDTDTVTRKIVEAILATELQHADALEHELRPAPATGDGARADSL